MKTNRAAQTRGRFTVSAVETQSAESSGPPLRGESRFTPKASPSTPAAEQAPATWSEFLRDGGKTPGGKQGEGR